LVELLGRADGGGLCDSELLELRDQVDRCAPLVVQLVRERCPRAAAPSRLRVRVLQIWRSEARLEAGGD
jgi:hypothetical protein